MENENENEFVNVLNGDLNQLARQRYALNTRGIKTEQSDVFPCVMRKDISNALRVIWGSSVEGWWNYKDLYLKHGTCTEEEFTERLKTL